MVQPIHFFSQKNHKGMCCGASTHITMLETYKLDQKHTTIVTKRHGNRKTKLPKTRMLYLVFRAKFRFLRYLVV